MQFCKSFFLIFMQIGGGRGEVVPFASLWLLDEAMRKTICLILPYLRILPGSGEFTTTDGRPRRDVRPRHELPVHRLLPDEALLEDLLVAEPQIGDVG